MPDNHQLTKADHERLSSILSLEYGIDLTFISPNRLRSAILRYCQRYSLSSAAECIEHVRNHRGDDGGLCDLVYPSRSWFNRSPEHFEFLVRMARELLSKRCELTGREIIVWSAACSSGQEAYTIAIYLMEAGFTGESSSRSFRVVGSDCSRDCLRRAREGQYPIDDVSKLSPIPYERYFTRVSDCIVSVRRPVRDALSFVRHNLLTSEYPFEQQPDFVFLRNALDHHMSSSRETVLKRVHRVLKAGGYLIFGRCHGLEPKDLQRLGYESVSPECYRAVPV
jgi:chemotaxis protein methyltransferase CheR